MMKSLNSNSGFMAEVKGPEAQELVALASKGVKTACDHQMEFFLHF